MSFGYVKSHGNFISVANIHKSAVICLALPAMVAMLPTTFVYVLFSLKANTPCHK